MRDGRLEFTWGVLHGPVEILDAARSQMRIEIAGTGTPVAYTFPGRGPARAIQIQGVTFTRVR